MPHDIYATIYTPDIVLRCHEAYFYDAAMKKNSYQICRGECRYLSSSRAAPGEFTLSFNIFSTISKLRGCRVWFDDRALHADWILICENIESALPSAWGADFYFTAGKELQARRTHDSVSLSRAANVILMASARYYDFYARLRIDRWYAFDYISMIGDARRFLAEMVDAHCFHFSCPYIYYITTGGTPSLYVRAIARRFHFLFTAKSRLARAKTACYFRWFFSSECTIVILFLRRFREALL